MQQDADEAYTLEFQMLQDNRTKIVNPSTFPAPTVAATNYWNNGGRLTDPEPFGIDPISEENAEIRRKAFEEKFPSTDVVFNELVNGRPQMFQEALLLYINITKRLNVG